MGIADYGGVSCHADRARAVAPSAHAWWCLALILPIVTRITRLSAMLLCSIYVEEYRTVGVGRQCNHFLLDGRDRAGQS